MEKVGNLHKKSYLNWSNKWNRTLRPTRSTIVGVPPSRTTVKEINRPRDGNETQTYADDRLEVEGRSDDRPVTLVRLDDRPLTLTKIIDRRSVSHKGTTPHNDKPNTSTHPAVRPEIQIYLVTRSVQVSNTRYQERTRPGTLPETVIHLGDKPRRQT